MSVRWITADVFDGLSQLGDDSIDLVVTSPPFLALRSYLPVDHPDKSKEIGSEATPAEFIDTLLAVTAELRRVLAPHGSIAVELGDTYAGSGGAGGDYVTTETPLGLKVGLRAGQPSFDGSMTVSRRRDRVPVPRNRWSVGWPESKSKALIPQLYEIALAYGINPLTGQPSPAGQWRIRNVVTWARPNPPVGALGDKWRPATSDLIVACTSSKRYWDDLATRRESNSTGGSTGRRLLPGDERKFTLGPMENTGSHPAGAPLLDYWEIPPGGYKGSHYAVFPEELVVPCVKAMCPEKVCRTCGEPSRRIVDVSYEAHGDPERHNAEPKARADYALQQRQENAQGMAHGRATKISETTGWTDCDCPCPVCGYPNHDDDDPANTCGGKWRPGIVLDPFAGSGTTLAVATGHGHDAIGIDLDPRNEDLARERIGPLMFEAFT